MLLLINLIKKLHSIKFRFKQQLKVKRKSTGFAGVWDSKHGNILIMGK